VSDTIPISDTHLLEVHCGDHFPEAVRLIRAHLVRVTKMLLTNVCNRAGELGCVDASAWLKLVESMP